MFLDMFEHEFENSHVIIVKYMKFKIKKFRFIIYFGQLQFFRV